MVAEDVAAAQRHDESEPVRKFESVYTPELAGGDVVFTDYEMVAGKLPGSSAYAADTEPRKRKAG